jgi:hypothetical protein
MTESRSDRRKIQIVDRAEQMRIIRAATVPMVIILVFALIAQLFFDFQLRRLASGHAVEITGLTRRFVSTLLFFVLATGYHTMSSIRLSNRVSGAAYRIKETLRAFRSGDTSVRARLRDGDLHTGVADELNSFLEWAEPQISAEPGRGRIGERPAGAESREDVAAASPVS